MNLKYRCQRTNSLIQVNKVQFCVQLNLVPPTKSSAYFTNIYIYSE